MGAWGTGADKLTIITSPGILIGRARTVLRNPPKIGKASFRRPRKVAKPLRTKRPCVCVFAPGFEAEQAKTGGRLPLKKRGTLLFALLCRTFTRCPEFFRLEIATAVGALSLNQRVQSAGCGASKIETRKLTSDTKPRHLPAESRSLKALAGNFAMIKIQRPKSGQS